MGGLVTFELRTTWAHAEAERAEAEASKSIQIEKIEQGEWLPGNPFVEARYRRPAAMVALATASALAERIVGHYLKDPFQGVEVDLRNQPMTISCMADLPPGYVVVIRPQGEVVYRRAGSSEWLASLLQESSD